jgi:hypothetical protein
MRIRDRIELYKDIYKDSGAIQIVREVVNSTGCVVGDDFEKLEALRELNTKLSDFYQVSIPVITVWVRDNNYVKATGEIYLSEPDLEGFLHQYRHHLQNVERKYERRGLTAEGSMDKKIWGIPYRDTVHRMYGEDDARAWAKFVIEAAMDQ